MKRVCLTRPFRRWLSKIDLSIDALCNAIQEMERRLIDANLGGGLVKKRVALPGRGKSGSTRTLVATNQGSLSLVLKRTIALKTLAADLLRLSSAQIATAITAKTLQEICHEN